MNHCSAAAAFKANVYVFTLGLLHESHLDVIANELSTVNTKWEKLGEQLGMDNELEGIRIHHADCLKEVIRQWLQRYGLHTWSHIVLALKSTNVGESQLGDYLKEKYLLGKVTINWLLWFVTPVKYGLICLSWPYF